MIVQVKKNIGREQWLVYLEEHKASKLSMAEFCRQKQLDVNAMYAWRNRLSLRPSKKSSGVKAVAFAKVQIEGNPEVPSLQMPHRARLNIGRQTTLEFEHLPEPAWIGALAKALGEDVR